MKIHFQDMHNIGRVAVVAACLFVFQNAAQAGLFSDEEARKLARDAQTQANTQNQALQTKLDAAQKAQQVLEQRVQQLESAIKGQGLIDLLNQIDRINGDLSKLKGQVEVLSHDVETTQQRQRDLYTDLDARLRKIEAPAKVDAESAPKAADAVPAPAVAAANPAVPSTPATTNPSVSAQVAADPAAELKAYDAAHSLFKAGKYKESAEAFDKFLETFPNSKYAPNAQYWLGYAYFSQKNYKAAIASQQKLLKQYPDHQKAPDAMYNIANSQIQQGDVDAAKASLRTLIEKYPLSDSAPLAKKRLTILDSLKSKN